MESIPLMGVTTIARDCDPTCHAEINAIRAACQRVASRFLEGCFLYTTYEPCPMCTSAAIWAKMSGIVYGSGREGQTEALPWRVMIPAADVVAAGTPRLELHAFFLKSECDELFLLGPN